MSRYVGVAPGTTTLFIPNRGLGDHCGPDNVWPYITPPQVTVGPGNTAFPNPPLVPFLVPTVQVTSPAMWAPEEEASVPVAPAAMPAAMPASFDWPTNLDLVRPWNRVEPEAALVQVTSPAMWAPEETSEPTAELPFEWPANLDIVRPGNRMLTGAGDCGPAIHAWGVPHMPSEWTRTPQWVADPIPASATAMTKGEVASNLVKRHYLVPYGSEVELKGLAIPGGKWFVLAAVLGFGVGVGIYRARRKR